MSYWIKQNKGDIPTISGKIFEEVLVRTMLLKRHDFERWESFQGATCNRHPNGVLYAGALYSHSPLNFISRPTIN